MIKRQRYKAEIRAYQHGITIDAVKAEGVRRTRHPVAQLEPPAVLWLNLETPGLKISLFFAAPSVARELAAQLIAAADLAEAEPAVCEGGCGYGCPR